ncbi:MAG: glutathione S-transferase family protein [Kangiellaceae bacterium]|nr:glutathione S-transferase family protein [Kangiellaceae bacterium]
MSKEASIMLISHKLCPYVQRAVIALKELNIPYKRIDIDLNNKPDWFESISPLGKVPVMVLNNDKVLFESAVIAEYVNDINQNRLLSKLPEEKAEQRAWIEFASATLANIGTLYSAKDEEAYNQALQTLNGKWSQLEKQLISSDFFSGEEFSLVDAAFAPMFRYFDVFELFSAIKIHERFGKINRWRQRLSRRTSVIGAVSPEYSVLLTQFIAVRGSYLGGIAKQNLVRIQKANKAVTVTRS